jgi:hypothetical protein
MLLKNLKLQAALVAVSVGRTNGTSSQSLVVFEIGLIKRIQLP